MFGFHLTRRWRTAAALAGMGAVGFALGAGQQPANVVHAQPPAQNAPATDYSQRVVAYIHGNVEITREELGEFLIARHGANKVELLVNRRIIEHACKQAGITVTPEEVEATIGEDLKQLSIDKSTFVKQFLKNYSKTLYEWKEDVVRPRLLLQKLVQGQVTVSEEELKHAFEATYGEKVVCRMIFWPKGQERVATQMWPKLRDSEAEFNSAATRQATQGLAQVGGKIDPIGRGMADADKTEVEKIAFNLKKDEVSQIFELGDQGVAVLKCDGRLPANTTKTFEAEKEALRKFVFSKKVERKIPEVFAELKKAANPVVLLKYGTSDKDVIQAAEEEIKLMNQQQKAGGRTGPAVPLPNGNQ